MRFFLLIAAGLGIGALSAVGIQTVLPHQSASLLAAVRSLGADAARFRLSDLNPIRATYDDVMRKVTSGQPARGFNFPSSPPIAVGSPITLPKPFTLDQDAIRRSMAAGINSRIQQDFQRSQAIIQYGRNPMGWHGPPPH